MIGSVFSPSSPSGMFNLMTSSRGIQMVEWMRCRARAGQTVKFRFQFRLPADQRIALSVYMATKNANFDQNRLLQLGGVGNMDASICASSGDTFGLRACETAACDRMIPLRNEVVPTYLAADSVTTPACLATPVP